jgi:DNA (cytosine-5)-methyltransferase 1
MKSPFKIIDLFSGPGGLGEGFSRYTSNGDHPFKIALSVEMEKSAHETLTLRAFYRQFSESSTPSEYWDYLAGKLGKKPDDELYKTAKLQREVQEAKNEAQNLTLGKNNRTINKKIEEALGKNKAPWVLIGGPPCQAYSLIGRSRNKGIKGYVAEQDHRNFLYKEYLKVISKFEPTIFVMENVKGMLSAKIEGEYIFNQILEDLHCPSRALNDGNKKTEYEIYPMVKPNQGGLFSSGKLEPKEYLIKSELFGIPQARHRVILLGIRKDYSKNWKDHYLIEKPPITTSTILSDLPKLRSGLSKKEDNIDNWLEEISRDSKRLVTQLRHIGQTDVADCITETLEKLPITRFSRGSNWSVKKSNNTNKKLSEELKKWYQGNSTFSLIVNHETRGHIQKDLHRYLYSSCYAKINNGKAPKTQDFPTILKADHANWNSGHFADRFRTQASNIVAKTITSHISKDGHYYIHYDPMQCRSLTVREAARIQTFPDDYFFVGNRTQQYVQVGNAVPPFLANQIAEIVYKCITNI